MIDTPFNYTGSKFNLLHQILPLCDYSKSLFIDVFTGSFVVGCNVVDKYDRILINDIISDLIGIHRELINNPDEIIEKVKELATCKTDENKYYELRDSYNKEKTPEKLWALMLSCTNNFLRFNLKGEMNQSWGRRGWNISIEFKVKQFVEHISKHKSKIYFSSVNFEQIPINTNGMYYLDPPYGFCIDEKNQITNKQISTAGYNTTWKQNDDIRLYDYIKNIDEKGASFMLSGLLNHNGNKSWIMSKLIEDGFKYKDLSFNYNKVSKIGEKDSQEIVIMNY